MSNIDEQFVEYIVKSLVGNPDAVKVVRTVDEKGVLLELTVDPEDLGRVIGKRGATAQSLRTLLRALGTKNEARYNLKIVDNGPPREDRAERQDSDARPAKDDQKAEDEAKQEMDEEIADAEEELETEESLASKTRKELEEFDDLDV